MTGNGQWDWQGGCTGTTGRLAEDCIPVQYSPLDAITLSSSLGFDLDQNAVMHLPCVKVLTSEAASIDFPPALEQHHI